MTGIVYGKRRPALRPAALKYQGYRRTAAFRTIQRPAVLRRLRIPGLLGSPGVRCAIFVFLTAVFAFSAMMIVLDYAQAAREQSAFEDLAAIAAQNADIPATSAVPEPSSGNAPVPPPASGAAILPQYRELHGKNTDMIGWIKIDGAGLDYPVMYTGDDFYLSHGFDREKSKSGVPFVDKRCAIDPFGTNTILYGHHMKSGAMFTALENYKDEGYYREHPVIRFDTLYAQREFEIIAVFRSRIYNEDDTGYKYYNFLTAGGKADFDDYIRNIKALALYDTGISASYGDELITLVTCSYHTENGQFVVVAKKTDPVT